MQNYKTFKVGDRITHHTFGNGTVSEIVPRTMEIDLTRIPIVKVTFDNLVRVNKTGEKIYTIEFTETTLNQNIIK